MLIESKTRKIGDSIGLILPEEALARMNLHEGESVFLSESADGGYRITSFNPELNEQVLAGESIIQRYGNALRELAK